MRLKIILRPLAGLRGVLVVWFSVLSVVTVIAATLVMSLAMRDRLVEIADNEAVRESAFAFARLDDISRQILNEAHFMAEQNVALRWIDGQDELQRQRLLGDFAILQRKGEAEFLILTDDERKVRLGVSTPKDTNGLFGVSSPWSSALNGRDTVEIQLVDGRMAIVAAAPVYSSIESPEPVGLDPVFGAQKARGVVVLGHYLDKHLAERIKEVTSTDVTLFDGRSISGTTLAQADLETILKPLQKTETGDTILSRGERYYEQHIHIGTMPVKAIFRPIKSDSGEILGFMVTAINDNNYTLIDEAGRQVLAGAIFISICLALALALIVSRYITKPIQKIETQARRIGDGDLEEPVESGGYREAKSLGQSIEAMRGRLIRLLREAQLFSDQMEDQVRQRTIEISTLFSVSQTITASLDVSSRLQDILAMVIESMPPANAAAIFLFPPEEEIFKLAASVGFDHEQLAQMQERADGAVFGKVYQAKSSLAFVGESELAGLVEMLEPRNRCYAVKAFEPLGDVGSVVFAPLIAQDKCLGVMLIANVGSSIENRVRAAQILADAIAIAISNSRLYQDLERQMEQLKHTQAMLAHSEKMASIGQLAAGVAHEINNPIGFINSNLNTLEEYAQDLKEVIVKAEEAQRALERAYNGQVAPFFEGLEKTRKKVDIDYVLNDLDNLIRESKEGSQRVRKIVLDLKTFSRADGGEIQSANVNAILESAINIVWNQLKYTCTVSKDFGQIPNVMCNSNQLGQVFVNLLVNASQAVGKDRPGHVGIRTYANERAVIIEVGDNGQGIRPEHLGKIFDPFFTTKPVGQGTGLGLSISYSIIEKHGGKMYVQSEVGVGTTFTMELPLAVLAYGK